MTNKTLIVAVSEFTTLTRSKAFVIGLILMPIIMAIAIGVERYTRDNADLRDRRFAVVDRSGVLMGPLQAAAEQRNRGADVSVAHTAPRFLPEPAAAGDGGREDALLAQLSDRVRRNELFAFV